MISIFLLVVVVLEALFIWRLLWERKRDTETLKGFLKISNTTNHRLDDAIFLAQRLKSSFESLLRAPIVKCPNCLGLTKKLEICIECQRDMCIEKCLPNGVGSMCEKCKKGAD